jgi:hypothetical protein
MLTLRPKRAAFPVVRDALFFVLGSPHRFATERHCDNKETRVPVKIGTFGPLSEAEFTELRQQKARKTDPAMAALLDEIANGQPVRVPLVEGQSARGLRTAISRAATSRGLSVETVEGEGFVAVMKVDEPRARKPTQQSTASGKRRGRPPKRQDHSLDEVLAAADNERIVPAPVIET